VALGVVFRPQAEAEAIEKRDWYESRRTGLGQEFGRALENLIARIAANALAFPRIHDETRQATLSRFPYAVHFCVAEATVMILAIHGRQDPARWKRRK